MSNGNWPGFINFIDADGAEQYVNIQYITGIKPLTIKRNAYAPNETSHAGKEMWVIGNAGYGTYSIRITLQVFDDHVRLLLPMA